MNTISFDTGVWNKKTIAGLVAGTLVGAGALAASFLSPLHIILHAGLTIHHPLAYAGGAVLLGTAGSAAYFYKKYRNRIKILKAQNVNTDLQPYKDGRDAKAATLKTDSVEISTTQRDGNQHILVRWRKS